MFSIWNFIFLQEVVLRTFLAFNKIFCITFFSRVTLGLLVYIFSFSFSLFAKSEELISFNNISASVSSDYKCQSKVNVRLDTPEEESYRKSRVDMQKLSRIVKTYLWLDCKEIESIDFEGYVEGNDNTLYSATAEKKNDWFLQEQSMDNTDDVEQKAGQKDMENEEQTPSAIKPDKDNNPPNSIEPANPQAMPRQKNNPSLQPKEKDEFHTLESLEAAAVSSSGAQLELAKGLLDLPDKIEGIEFPDDAGRGIKILEKLAAEGNPDAIQLLSEAYSSDKGIDLNIPLIEALTGQPLVDSDDQRGVASAMMTLDAASKGSELAVNDLQDAGQAGSHMSYYALGMMYLLDKALKMPYEQEFLEQELDIELDVSGPGGSGNVDVGLHFLKLAAEKGNSESQELLTDMEIEFEVPEPSNGSSGSPASSQQTVNNTTTYTEALMELGTLNDVLERRAQRGAASSEPDSTKPGGALSQSQRASTAGKKTTIKNTSSVGTGSGQKAAAGTSNRQQQAKPPRNHSTPGNMNTKQNEAEIID